MPLISEEKIVENEKIVVREFFLHSVKVTYIGIISVYRDFFLLTIFSFVFKDLLSDERFYPLK
jgi:hypothetical protein